jgi:hypothetical protein
MNDTIKAAAVIIHLSAADPDAALHLLTLRREFGDVCAIYGCERPHRSLGMCEMHLGRHKRAVANEAHTINRTAKRKAAA